MVKGCQSLLLCHKYNLTMESAGLDFESVFTVDKGYTDSESENEREDGTKVELVDCSAVIVLTKKASDEQIDYMFSFMEERPDFPKGKMKLTEANKKLIADWEELCQELNKLGPAKYTNSEWRKVWTNVKANKKRRMKKPHRDSRFLHEFSLLLVFITSLV